MIKPRAEKRRVFHLLFLFCVTVIGIFLGGLRPAAVAQNARPPKFTGPPLDSPLLDESAQGNSGTNQTKRIFKGYGRFKKEFQDMCSKLRADGRSDRLSEMLSQSLPAQVDCRSCAALFKSIYSACKPPKVRLKTGESRPSPPSKQREPSVEVVDSVSRVFSAMAQDPDLKMYAAPAVRRMKQVVLDTTGKTRAEIDYYGIVMEFAAAPFKEITPEGDENAQKEGGAAAPEPAKSVDLKELFDN